MKYEMIEILKFLRFSEEIQQSTEDVHRPYR